MFSFSFFEFIRKYRLYITDSVKLLDYLFRNLTVPTSRATFLRRTSESIARRRARQISILIWTTHTSAITLLIYTLRVLHTQLLSSNHHFSPSLSFSFLAANFRSKYSSLLISTKLGPLSLKYRLIVFIVPSLKWIRRTPLVS